MTEPPLSYAEGRVCVVTAGGPHPWIIINALADHFGDVQVIIEGPERRGAFLARRARLQGWVSVFGQFGTMCLIGVGKALFRRRIARIIASEGLRVEPRAGLPIRNIASVNSGDFLRAIDQVRPSVVLLAGCRILRPDALAGLPCPRRQETGREGGHEGIQVSGRRADGDERVHVRGKASQGGQTLRVEAAAGKGNHERRQCELQIPAPLHADRRMDKIVDRGRGESPFQG